MEEEFYEFAEAGLYDLGDGEDPVEFPEGFYDHDDEEGVWYVLDESDGEAYEVEIHEVAE
jgi:hypothetical protein